MVSFIRFGKNVKLSRLTVLNNEIKVGPKHYIFKTRIGKERYNVKVIKNPDENASYSPEKEHEVLEIYGIPYLKHEFSEEISIADQGKSIPGKAWFYPDYIPLNAEHLVDPRISQDVIKGVARILKGQSKLGVSILSSLSDIGIYNGKVVYVGHTRNVINRDIITATKLRGMGEPDIKQHLTHFLYLVELDLEGKDPATKRQIINRVKAELWRELKKL